MTEREAIGTARCWFGHGIATDCHDAALCAKCRELAQLILLHKPDYEIGKQPCANFSPQFERSASAMWENVHECPKCGGNRSFCTTCGMDHHMFGWERCQPCQK